MQNYSNVTLAHSNDDLSLLSKLTATAGKIEQQDRTVEKTQLLYLEMQ
jgi:hypothetical protein